MESPKAQEDIKVSDLLKHDNIISGRWRCEVSRGLWWKNTFAEKLFRALTWKVCWAQNLHTSFTSIQFWVRKSATTFYPSQISPPPPPNCFLIKCCECAHAQIKMGSWECWHALQLNGHDQCPAQHKVSENFPKRWPFLLAQSVLVSSINGWISLNMTDDLIQYSASPFLQQGVTDCWRKPWERTSTPGLT